LPCAVHSVEELAAAVLTLEGEDRARLSWSWYLPGLGKDRGVVRLIRRGALDSPEEACRGMNPSFCAVLARPAAASSPLETARRQGGRPAVDRRPLQPPWHPAQGL